MRSLRRVRARHEWRSSNDAPIPKDYFAWLDNPWLQNFVFVGLVAALGFFAQNISVGMVLTGLYGAASLALRLPSDLTFRVALMGLVALPALTFANQQELVGIYAQYVFLLLSIGTAGALVEQWRHKESPLEVGLRVHAKVGADGRPAIQTNMYRDGRNHEDKLAVTRTQGAFA